MQKIEEQRAAMRTRLEAALGVRLGFTMEEAAEITGISKKGFYNHAIGFRIGGKRRVGVEDLLDLVVPLLKKRERELPMPSEGTQSPPSTAARGAPTKTERIEALRLGITVKELRAQRLRALQEGSAA